MPKHIRRSAVVNGAALADMCVVVQLDRSLPTRNDLSEPRFTAGQLTASLERIVRGRFAGAGGSTRVGIEIEAIPARASSGAPVMPHADEAGPGTLDVLRALAQRNAWREEDTGYEVPRFVLPDGSMISYEPGGQLEWSSAVHEDLVELDGALRSVADRLAAAMDEEEIVLLARGIDPITPLDAARQVLTGERYRRQRLHYDRIGSAGRAMMLQTAGIHLNIDPGPEPLQAWNAANTIAPLMVAVFANSPKWAIETTPRRSNRAAIWRRLDPSRTTVFAASTDPARDYLAFALGARSFLLGDPDTESLPFSAWRDSGGSDDDFARHLTTLFPEVRPRGGYLELRSVDALPARMAIVPLGVAQAAMHDASLRADVVRELPPPTLERLDRAAHYGLGDSALAAEARWLVEGVPAALARLLPKSAASRELLGRLESFFAEYTLRGRDPGMSPESRLASGIVTTT